VSAHRLVLPGQPSPLAREGDCLWQLLDPFAVAPANPAWPKGRDVLHRTALSLDGALLDWNPRAKFRLREAGWPVQGGMTYHTLDLLREWARTQIQRHQPDGFHLHLPEQARFPDLSSPNACLLACAIVPVLREAVLPLLISSTPGLTGWETAKGGEPSPPGPTSLLELARQLEPAPLWVAGSDGLLLAQASGPEPFAEGSGAP